MRVNTPSIAHRVILGTSFIAGQAVVLWILLEPLSNQRWWLGFRGYFSNDQLSYAAIAVTAAKGNFTPVEPLTETGVSHYPSLWYLILGLTSFLTGQPVHLLWTITGIAFIGASVAFLGYVAYRLSSRALAPLLPALAMLTGTFSVITSDWWYTTLGSHSVIWGPFGTLFTLNAEAVGLAINLVIFALLIWVLTVMRASRVRVAILISAFLLGVLANVQTYSFLTGVSLAVVLAASYALLTFPSRRRLQLTITLVVVVLLAGRALADLIGPLPLFALLILATLPAIWPVIKAYRGQAAVAISVFILAAAPQVVRTVFGIASGDDFLTYRQASTLDLGVNYRTALIAAVPLLLIALFTTLTLIATRPATKERRAITSLLIALGVGMAIMSSNDLWGFDQEPYRFWLQYSFIAVMLLSITTAWSLRQWHRIDRPWRIATAVAGIFAAIAWLVSLSDVLAFRSFAAEQGVIVIQDEAGSTLQSLVPENEGLVLSSRCLDPQVLKLITRAPVVSFNRGLAWPENRVVLDAFSAPDRGSVLTFDELAQANVRYVLTDASCESEWQLADGRIQPVDIKQIGERTFTLWRVQLPIAVSE